MYLIEKQGQVVRIARLSDVCPLKNLASKRGEIKGFSRKSRRRLIDLMARLDTSRVRKTFLTLTFQGTPTPDEARAAFKRFSMRLRRNYQLMSAVWRVELQERGSAHYHLMCFDLPYIPQRKLQDMWTECTREQRSIVNVQLIRSHKGVMKYVSKYIAKTTELKCSPSLDYAPYQHAEEKAFKGRQWGYINKEALPMAERHIGMMIDEEVINYFYWCCGAAARGHRKTSAHSTRWYSGEAQAIFECALNAGGFDLARDEAFNVMARQKHQTTRIKTSYFFAGVGTHL